MQQPPVCRLLICENVIKKHLPILRMVLFCAMTSGFMAQQQTSLMNAKVRPKFTVPFLLILFNLL